MMAFHPSLTVFSVRSHSLPEATVPSLCLSWFSDCWVGPLSPGWLVWCFLMLCLPQTTVCIPASVPLCSWSRCCADLLIPFKRSDWCFMVLYGGDPWNMGLHLSSSSSSEFYHWSFQPHFLSFCRDSFVFFLPARLLIHELNSCYNLII